MQACNINSVLRNMQCTLVMDVMVSYNNAIRSIISSPRFRTALIPLNSHMASIHTTFFHYIRSLSINEPLNYHIQWMYMAYKNNKPSVDIKQLHTTWQYTIQYNTNSSMTAVCCGQKSTSGNIMGKNPKFIDQNFFNTMQYWPKRDAIVKTNSVY